MLLFGRPLSTKSVISGSAKKFLGNKRKHSLLPELWARASASAELLGSQISLWRNLKNVTH